MDALSHNCPREVKSLIFTVPGTLISGNHNKHVGFHKTAAARDFIERVRSIAIAHAKLVDWTIPEYVRIVAVLYNQRSDIDNSVKELYDALQTIAYTFDSRILYELKVKRKDKFGPRTVVMVREVDPKVYGY